MGKSRKLTRKATSKWKSKSLSSRSKNLKNKKLSSLNNYSSYHDNDIHHDSDTDSDSDTVLDDDSDDDRDVNDGDDITINKLALSQASNPVKTHEKLKSSKSKLKLKLKSKSSRKLLKQKSI